MINLSLLTHNPAQPTKTKKRVFTLRQFISAENSLFDDILYITAFVLLIIEMIVLFVVL